MKYTIPLVEGKQKEKVQLKLILLIIFYMPSASDNALLTRRGRKVRVCFVLSASIGNRG